MLRTKLAFTWLSIVLVAVVLSGCSAKPKSEKPSIVIAAAANLDQAGKALGEGFEKAGGSATKFSFGASGNLEQQIRQGAPFDVYAPADISYCQSVAQAGLVDGDCRIYALGSLVAWSNSLTITSLDILKGDSVKKFSIANPQVAPYGHAAKEALQAAGLWDQLQTKLVIADSVAQAYQLAQTGNVEVALISRSLVIGTSRAPWVVDTKLYQPIRQAVAVLKSSKNPSEAARFRDFLFSAQGRAILDHFGFNLPELEGQLGEQPGSSR